MTTIPPIIARGVLIDVAGQKGVEALPKGYEITVADLEAALRAQNDDVTPGTVVLIRTGTARYWGANGGDHAKIADPDTAGIDLAAAKWLVEQQGAMMIGSDTSGLEYVPPKPEDCRPSAAPSSRSTSICWSTRASTSASSTTSNASPRPRLRVRLCGDHQRHPRHRRRHRAPPDGAALNASGNAPPPRTRPAPL